MKLSVIIPYYKAKDLIGTLLTTIKNQDLDKNEYEVLIIDDFSPIPLTEDDVKEYGLNLKVLRLPENFGPGVARQRGIMEAKGEFLMFCDADDYLSKKNTFSYMLEHIGDNDIYITTFIEETNVQNDEGKTICIPHTGDRTWMHGKLYRKSFIDEKKLFFHPLLRANEDGYFNNIAFSETDKYAYDDSYMSYVWKNNRNSITRSNDNEYNYSGYHEFIQGVRLALLELYRRKNKHLYDIFLSSVGLIYYTFQSDIKGWRKHKQHYDTAIKEFKDLYTQFSGIYDYIDKNDFYDAMNVARFQQYNSGNKFLEKQTFKQFIKSLDLKVYEIF